MIEDDAGMPAFKITSSEEPNAPIVMESPALCWQQVWAHFIDHFRSHFVRMLQPCTCHAHNQAIEFLGYVISVALRAGHAEIESKPSVQTPQDWLNAAGIVVVVCCNTASA